MQHRDELSGEISALMRKVTSADLLDRWGWPVFPPGHPHPG
jgi:hypothetical protein